MHPAKRKTKPITSYFTKIPRSGQTSYEDEDASSEIEVAGEAHTHDHPQLLLRTSSKAASCSSSTTSEMTCEFDIGLYDPASRPDEQTKYDYLTRHWKPPQGYKFPKLERRVKSKIVYLSFQRAWLEKYQWLAYSPAKKGAFCKDCRISAPSEFGD